MDEFAAALCYQRDGHVGNVGTSCQPEVLHVDTEVAHIGDIIVVCIGEGEVECGEGGEEAVGVVGKLNGVK